MSVYRVWECESSEQKYLVSPSDRYHYQRGIELHHSLLEWVYSIPPYSRWYDARLDIKIGKPKVASIEIQMSPILNKDNVVEDVIVNWFQNEKLLCQSIVSKKNLEEIEDHIEEYIKRINKLISLS